MNVQQCYRYIVQQPRVRKMIISNRVIRDIAWKFVAGETLEAGLEAVRDLNSQGIQGLLNYVGQHVLDGDEAIARTESTIESIKRIAAEGLKAHISVKLTNVGLDAGENLCRHNLGRILACAGAAGVFVWIDMEEYRYLSQTLRLCEDMRSQYGVDSIGAVVQSYLRLNNPLPDLLRRGWRVRLVKGGYCEPRDVVYRKQTEVDEAFRHDIQLALSTGTYAAIATHDALFIALVNSLAPAKSPHCRDVEFQMLYGVREDLQAHLVNEGYTVRSYVPYGADWQSYVMGCVRREVSDMLSIPPAIRI